MKDEAQAKLREKNSGLSDEEILRRRREWLETSGGDVATWYRKMRDRQAAASAVREKPDA